MSIVIPLFFTSVGFYFLHRLVFLSWNWSFFRNQSLNDIGWAFLNGFRFDLASISILILPVFLLGVLLIPLKRQKLKRSLLVGIYLVLQLPLMVLNLGDSEYVGFTGRRFTFESLFAFREVPGKFWQIVFSYGVLSLIGTLLLVAFVYFCVKHFTPRPLELKIIEYFNSNRKRVKAASLFLGFILLAVLARGGLQKKPLGFAHAQVFPSPMLNNLVLNSAFTFLQSSQRKSLSRYKFFEDREQMKLFLNGALPGPSLLEKARPEDAQKVAQNVVLIIVESLNYEYMGYPHNDTGYTPFLDSLAKRGLLFKNYFANGRRSIEGIAAILGGIPALMTEPFLSSQYMSNYFLGIGTLIGQKGYHSSFFHGGQNGTMYFDSFIQSVGIQNYFGRNEYPMQPGDDDGTWGVWDEPFLKWTVNKFNNFPQPFFSGIFTLSSHNPFTVPEKYQGRFPKGTIDIHEVIGYTDYSLEQFFKEAEKQDWYKNTLFIITADHTHKSSRAAYENDIGKYRIPLILFHPTLKLPDLDTNAFIQQIDIMPTILDYVGVIEKERNYLNRSIFVPGQRSVILLADQKFLMVDSEVELVANTNLFDKNSVNFKASGQDVVLSDEIKQQKIDKLKATIQYFSEGLWDNKIYYPVSK